jgi:RNA polymerase sigma factor (sigma-70 family)
MHEDGFSLLDTLQRAQQGDAAALDRVIARLQPRLRRFATRRLPAWARGVAETEDLVQDVLMNTVRQLPQLQLPSDAQLYSYLCAAIRKRVLDEMRRARVRPMARSLDSQSPDLAPPPDEAAAFAELHERYERACARLTEEQRQAVTLWIDLGMSYSEIATITAKPSADAVRMLIARSLAKVANAMGRDRG